MSYATKSDTQGFKDLTIENIVFGKIDLINADFFDMTKNDSSLNYNIKQSIASWYQVSFKIAQVLSIVVLIYIGIRMAIATTAAQQVTYKTMFKYWLQGFILLFVIHYGMIFILRISNWLVSIIPETLVKDGFETTVVEYASNWSDVLEDKVSVWLYLVRFVSYCVIVLFQFRFLLAYLKRLIIIAFLIIIAPLITVTYAIDKAGNNKAEAFVNCRKMFLENVFMQPLQAFLYAIFIFSASAIVKAAPVLAIVFFYGITKGEKIFKKVFNLGYKNTIE